MPFIGNFVDQNAIPKSVLVATGDTIVAAGAFTPTRLPAGAADTVIQSKSGSPAFRTLLQLMQDVIGLDWRSIALAGWASTVTGGGVVTTSPELLQIRNSPPVAGTGYLNTTNGMGLSRGQGVAAIDWTKAIGLSFKLTPASAANATAVTRFTLGKNPVLGVLAERGIGIQIDNMALKGIVHDGTSGATVDLNTALSVFTTVQVLIISDGAGNVTWWVNDVSVGTTAAGPKTLGNANFGALQFEMDDGGTATAYDPRMHGLKLLVGQ